MVYGYVIVGQLAADSAVELVEIDLQMAPPDIADLDDPSDEE